jgi:taurine dioxygenase
MIVVKGLDLDAAGLDRLARKLGDPVVLPADYALGSQFKATPSVSRVGNVVADGGVMPNHSASEYWHQDGQFHIGVKRQIWNFLYGVEVPTAGGQTGFADAERALDDLPADLLEKIRDREVIVDPNRIPDFKNSAVYRASVRHPVISTYPVGARSSIYIGNAFSSRIDGWSDRESQEIVLALFEHITRDENVYCHGWEAGDLLIWNNFSVFHRSMGGYGNARRLLFKCQTRMHQ